MSRSFAFAKRNEVIEEVFSNLSSYLNRYGILRYLASRAAKFNQLNKVTSKE